MKYKLRYPKQKNKAAGGAYWQGADFKKHLKLTDSQTSYQYLLNNFPAPQKILEAGCGIGRWVIPLAEKGYEVTGIELEKEALDIIRKNYSNDNISLVHGDIFKMPFPENTFDMVISLGVLEHFEDKKLQSKGIAEHVRVLKDDGVFFVTVPYLSLIRFLIHVPFLKLVSLVRFFKGKEEYFSEYRYSRSTFKKILEQNNIKVVESVWDDLLSPYSFGLTVDSPLKRITNSKDGEQYKLSKTGLFIHKVLWKIHPGLISGGVGFICKKV